MSLIRGTKVLLRLPPVNLLDAAALPIDISRETPDPTPCVAILPEVATDNLLNPGERASSGAYEYWVAQIKQQDLSRVDMADPQVLNRIIWSLVRGSGSPMPSVTRPPVLCCDAIGDGRAG